MTGAGGAAATGNGNGPDGTRPAAPEDAPPSLPPAIPAESGAAEGASPSTRGLPRVPQSRALVGSFDAIDHGYEASGWIFDLSQPARTCMVELRLDGQPAAQLPANIPRADLASVRIRPQSGFRFTLPATAFDGVIRSVEVFAMPENLRIGQARPLAAVINDHKVDPKTFSVDSILKLQDGAVDFERLVPPAFLARHGARAAVAYAYLWLMKRPPDRAGWDHYSERILAGEISIGGFLRELAASDEALRAKRAGIDLAIEFESILHAAARLPPDRSRRG